MSITVRTPYLGVHIPQVVPISLGFMLPQFAPHWLTSNTSHPPVVISASSEFPSLQAWMAFDGTTANYYIGTGGGVDWLQTDIGSGKAFILGQYAIRVNPVPEPNRAPKNWTMQGSNNGSTWDTLDTQTNQIGWGNGETRTFTPSVRTTAYRYFRLNITANNGDGTYTQVEEFYLYAAPPAGQTDFAPHALTVASAGGYTVSASSYFFSDYPWHAFDGSDNYITSRWMGEGGGVDWLRLDTPGSWLLDSYVVEMSTSGEAARAPKNWTMEGSNDGSIWTVVDTVTNATGWQRTEARFFNCDVKTTYYRYFRLNITANNGDATYTQVGELYLYGS